MKITFLGTSAATACPLVFCKCKVCEYARNNKGKDIRKRSSVIINDDLLIDFGPDVTTSSSMYNVDLTKVKYILQTHGHSDHFDAGHLITRLKEYASENVEKISLYASKETVVALDKWFKTEDQRVDLFDEGWLKRLSMDIHYVKSGDTVKVGNYIITPIESLHDTNENSLIYIISFMNNNVLYGTDLLEISDNMWDILKKFKLDVVILDHTYGEGYNAGGHLDAGQVFDIITKMKLEGIVDSNGLIFATHISHEGNDIHENMERISLNKGYQIAYDGLVVNIHEI